MVGPGKASVWESLFGYQQTVPSQLGNYPSHEGRHDPTGDDLQGQLSPRASIFPAQSVNQQRIGSFLLRLLGECADIQ